jgi:hypothetical protein
LSVLPLQPGFDYFGNDPVPVHDLSRPVITMPLTVKKFDPLAGFQPQDRGHVPASGR